MRDIDFSYDYNGLRTQKKEVENGITTIHDYTLHGKLITHLTKRVVDLDGVETSEELHFFYDTQSRPAKVSFGGVLYTYIHNLQGDIVGILDNAGALVVEYKYDVWGKPTIITGTLKTALGELSPFRHRGYVYDTETGLYYLRSRYYNPVRSRFINADTVLSKVSALGTHNLFAYCANNPVIMVDPDGNSAVVGTILLYAVPFLKAAVVSALGGIVTVLLSMEARGLKRLHRQVRLYRRRLSSIPLSKQKPQTPRKRPKKSSITIIILHLL